MSKLHFNSIVALLSLLVNVNGSSDTNISPIFAPSEVMDNIRSLIINQTIACENLDRKLDQVLQKQQELMEALLVHHPGTSIAHPASSCKNVLELDPTASSGYYFIGSESGNSNYVYCDMTRRCGGDKGWMQLFKLDMTNHTNTCPQGLTEYSYNRKHVCRRDSNGGGCSSVNIASYGIDYSKVCGKVVAYQFASPDGFRDGNVNIDGVYLDGVSITRGRYPRTHIWSFAAVHDERVSHGRCPCINHYTSLPTPPSFVGSDYFCDAASESGWGYTFYSADPLWDGRGCGVGNSCCARNSPPKFVKILDAPTNDNIELRVCRDQERGDEDILIETVEIYVQ